MVRRHREISGIAVLRRDAPQLHEGLIGAALPLVIASVVGGTTALVLLVVRRYWAVRVASVSAVVAVVWGWAVGQYPFLLSGQVTIDEAAHPATCKRYWFR